MNDMWLIIYQSSKFSFSCVLLVESVSREIDEIKLSFASVRERGRQRIIRPVNNEKESRALSHERTTFGQPKTSTVSVSINKC